MFTLTQTDTLQRLNYLKHQRQHQNNYYKLCFTVEQPLIYETAGLFPVKIEYF
jgi:hypothetical protein